MKNYTFKKALLIIIVIVLFLFLLNSYVSFNEKIQYYKSPFIPFLISDYYGAYLYYDNHPSKEELVFYIKNFVEDSIYIDFLTKLDFNIVIDNSTITFYDFGFDKVDDKLLIEYNIDDICYLNHFFIKGDIIFLQFPLRERHTLYKRVSAYRNGFLLNDFNVDEILSVLPKYINNFYISKYGSLFLPGVFDSDSLTNILLIFEKSLSKQIEIIGASDLDKEFVPYFDMGITEPIFQLMNKYDLDKLIIPIRIPYKCSLFIDSRKVCPNEKLD